MTLAPNPVSSAPPHSLSASPESKFAQRGVISLGSKNKKGHIDRAKPHRR